MFDDSPLRLLTQERFTESTAGLPVPSATAYLPVRGTKAILEYQAWERSE